MLGLSSYFNIFETYITITKILYHEAISVLRKQPPKPISTI